MLAEELIVTDADAPLWAAARPFVDAALRLSQNGDDYTWHGWNRQQIATFLATLPQHCSLVVGVWEVLAVEGTLAEQEALSLGVVCEVVDGKVVSLCTFDAFTEAGLKATKQLEPGIEDALEIMQVARSLVAPVAWALFTDKATWNTWVLACDGDGGILDKEELLAAFARQGRCVLMGSQAVYHH